LEDHTDDKEIIFYLRLLCMDKNAFGINLLSVAIHQKSRPKTYSFSCYFYTTHGAYYSIYFWKNCCTPHQCLRNKQTTYCTFFKYCSSFRSFLADIAPVSIEQLFFCHVEKKSYLDSSTKTSFPF